MWLILTLEIVTKFPMYACRLSGKMKLKIIISIFPDATDVHVEHNSIFPDVDMHNIGKKENYYLNVTFLQRLRAWHRGRCTQS